MFNNQFNPYYQYPIKNSLPFSYRQPFHINWKSLLNNTQKTVNVINQTAPLFYQLKPLYQNIKTMLKVKKILHENHDDEKEIISNQKKDISSNEPIFFL